jgi:hypothetical protein
MRKIAFKKYIKHTRPCSFANFPTYAHRSHRCGVSLRDSSLCEVAKIEGGINNETEM